MNNSKIKKIISREILDSRGNPTVEAEVHLYSGDIGKASVPSGASTGAKEAVELRDNDLNRYLGKGVQKAINNINQEIAGNLINLNAENQDHIDHIMIELDGTKNKSRIGANSILAVSLATAKAVAKKNKIHLFNYIAEINQTKEQLSLPLPMINIVNGGAHARNNIDIQEFMIQPIGAKNIKHAIQMGSEIFHILGKVLEEKGYATSIGDEGGYAPNLNSSDEVLSMISLAIEKSNFCLGKDIVFAIDCAASELYNKKTKKYYLPSEKKELNSIEFTNYLKLLSNKYPISSIEDGQSEIDWDGFLHQTKILGRKIQLVGDDLFVTNVNILNKGIKKNIANAILIKPNQIGTLTETLETIKLAKKNHYNVIISHRSGETEDTSIADLSVGVSAGQIKTGSICRTDRIVKYNRLMRIEDILIKTGKALFEPKKYILQA